MLAVMFPGVLSDNRSSRCRSLPAPPSKVLCQRSPCGSLFTGKWLPVSFVLLRTAYTSIFMGMQSLCHLLCYVLLPTPAALWGCSFVLGPVAAYVYFLARRQQDYVVKGIVNVPACSPIMHVRS